MLLSAVIPVFNEADSLVELHGELLAVGRDAGFEWDILFVDDGSTDGSWAVIEKLAAEQLGVRGIRFRRNFGKAAALNAGFQAARGEFVFTFDADLQDDPREVPKFLEKLGAGLDVVSGWKKVRHDPWHKVGPSRVFNWLVGKLTGVRLHDHNCGFKCYRREVLGEIHLYGELHRFVPVLAAARGWKVGEIEVEHRRRKFGRSKYGVHRFAKGFLDLLTVWFLTGYGQRPQHVLGTLGLLSFLLGGLGIVGLSGWWIASRMAIFTEWVPGLEPIHLHERAIFYFAIVALLLGAQFISVGLLAEMLAAHRMRDAQPYSIQSRTFDDDRA